MKTEIVISLVIGVIIGIIFFRLMPRNNQVHGPNSKDIIGKIYKDPKNGKYYKFEPVVYVCPISISMNSNQKQK